MHREATVLAVSSFLLAEADFSMARWAFRYRETNTKGIYNETAPAAASSFNSFIQQLTKVNQLSGEQQITKSERRKRRKEEEEKKEKTNWLQFFCVCV